MRGREGQRLRHVPASWDTDADGIREAEKQMMGGLKCPVQKFVPYSVCSEGVPEAVSWGAPGSNLRKVTHFSHTGHFELLL